MVLMKLPCRQAVHQIAGLRGLFPDEAFKRREIVGLPNVMELKARRGGPSQPLRHYLHRLCATVAGLILAHTGGIFGGNAPGLRLD